MKTLNRFLVSLYRLMLHLYPRKFRQEYSEEMTAVFLLRLQKEKSSFKNFVFFLAELYDLPICILNSQLQDKNDLLLQIEKRLNFAPGTWREILLACLPAFLIGLVPALASLFPASQTFSPGGFLVLLTFFFLLAGLGVAGLLAKLPRWVLGYAGVPLAGIPLGFLSYLYYLLSPSLTFSLEFPVLIFGLHFVFLLLLGLLVFALIRFTNKVEITSRFAKRLGEEHSLLSFMLYGSAVVLILGQYEDLPEGAIFLVFSALCLGLGVWRYLSLQQSKQKINALMIGSNLACMVFLGGILFLHSTGRMIYSTPLHLQRMLISLGITWLTTQILILAPFLYLRRPGRSVTVNG